MAEEERNEKIEEAKDEQAAPEAEAEQQPEAAEEKPPPEEAASEQDAEDASSDFEGLDWKGRRRLERSRRPAEPRPEHKPADRAAERAQQRAAARKARSSYRRKRRQGGDGTGTAPADRRSVARKMRQGRVVSDKADKTITVRIDVAHRHPTYEKIVRNSSTLRAHDERNEAGEGDLVRVVETRPLSRHKRWRLVEVLEKAK